MCIGITTKGNTLPTTKPLQIRHNAEYFPVPVDAIKSKSLGMDLFLIYENGQVVLYRTQGSSYSTADCAQITTKGITHFYVPKSQHRQFQAAVELQLEHAYNDPAISQSERARIIRGACSRMIKDFMQDPRASGLSESISNMATRFDHWLSEDQSKFGLLLEMSEHDFYTSTHMVNVGVSCGLLGAELLGQDDPMVRDLMHGGLVHDLGKFGVPVDVLNKEGKLTDVEWDLIRQHPQVGAQILETQPNTTRTILDMTLSHHERLDGKGYPNGLTESEITLASKICAVVDIYDALTSARPYRGPIPPRVVLDIMRKDVGTAIDQSVFKAWERVIERLIAEDPERALPEIAGGSPTSLPSLESMIPNAILQSEPEQIIEEPQREVCLERTNGEELMVEILSADIEQMTLLTSAAFRPGEKVKLFESSSSELSMIYKSKYFDSLGSVICVFAIIERNKKAA